MKKNKCSAWHVLIIHFENILLLQKYPFFECLSVILHGNCKILLCNYVHVSSKLLISGVIIPLAHTNRTWQARVHCIIKFPLLCLFWKSPIPIWYFVCLHSVWLHNACKNQIYMYIHHVRESIIAYFVYILLKCSLYTCAWYFAHNVRWFYHFCICYHRCK